ncbi:putative sucrose-phosphate synthase 1 [Capsicum baccatum]|uniref:sucrose-phosphate synthase n=1 Tax=Capsicum baccatum TaxID=33114 RepID=A0A2G2W547_CAPBA|nr:putative sucrose-phosphate synthase 1 [Capsicum baccatum]
MIITSTRQEIEEQWNLYDGFDPKLERKLRARTKRNMSCFGRFMPRTMTLVMGNRDVIDEMSSTNSSVLVSIIKLIDKYDLYGQVVYPKHHNQSDVPEIYHLDAKSKGIFINPAFIEPFGLILIEEAAHGLPILATKNGGPVDIHRVCPLMEAAYCFRGFLSVGDLLLTLFRVLDNGLIVDPHDQHAVADALLKLVSDKQLWARCRDNGLGNIHLFSWPEHCKTYLEHVMSCKQRQPRWKRNEDECSNSEPDSPGDSLRDIKLETLIGRG